ncbi:MAG: hypothetical protein ACD_11C00029G0047 [uncultured bacterium]|nr:MAG: hypothetical protein ACD_11C00029G0047 [uncultured bacterium]HBR72077.1 hypothetical protein [Candidatus Moranbacteria bacterium]
MKKTIFSIIIIALISMGTYLYFLGVENYQLINDEGKKLTKNILKKISEIVYREATIHNPEGDMLPDQVDDIIKEKIKENIE